MTAWVYVEGAPAGAGETRTGENGRALSPLAVVGTPTGTDGGTTTTASTTPRVVLGGMAPRCRKKGPLKASTQGGGAPGVPNRRRPISSYRKIEGGRETNLNGFSGSRERTIQMF